MRMSLVTQKVKKMSMSKKYEFTKNVGIVN